MFVNCRHPENALSPMDVTLSGIIMVPFNFLQPSKQLSGICLIFSEIVSPVNDPHPENAL